MVVAKKAAVKGRVREIVRVGPGRTYRQIREAADVLSELALNFSIFAAKLLQFEATSRLKVRHVARDVGTIEPELNEVWQNRGEVA